MVEPSPSMVPLCSLAEDEVLGDVRVTGGRPHVGRSFPYGRGLHPRRGRPGRNRRAVRVSCDIPPLED